MFPARFALTRLMIRQGTAGANQAVPHRGPVMVDRG